MKILNALTPTSALLLLIAAVPAHAAVNFTANDSFIDIYSESEEASPPYRTDFDLNYLDAYPLPPIPGTFDESAGVSSSAGPDSSSADGHLVAQISTLTNGVEISGYTDADATANSSATPGYYTYSQTRVVLAFDFTIEASYDFTFSAIQNGGGYGWVDGFIAQDSMPLVTLFGAGHSAYGYVSNSFNGNLSGQLEPGNYTLVIRAYAEALPDEINSAGGSYDFTLAETVATASPAEDVPLPPLAGIALSVLIAGIGTWNSRKIKK